MPQLVVGFSSVEKNDIDLVSEKGAILGELSRMGIPFPAGFIVTTEAYKEFVKDNNLDQKINHLINAGISFQIKKYTRSSHMPHNVGWDIVKAYRRLGGVFKEESVDVNSEKAIKGEANLLVKIKEEWIKNRGKAILIKKSLQPKVSGIVWTHIPHNKHNARIAIQVSSNLPNLYEISKQTGDILFKAIYKATQRFHQLTDQQVLSLAKIAQRLARYFYFPQEAKWAIENGKVYITEVREIADFAEKSSRKSQKQVFLKGKPFGFGISSGPIRIIRDANEIHATNPQEILVISESITYRSPIVKERRGLLVNDRKLKRAANILRDGHIVTLNAISGEIYKGGFL